MIRTNLIDDLTLVALPQWWENPWVWFVGLVALGLAIWGILRWLHRVRPVVTPPGATAYGPLPAADALRRLEALKARLPGVPDYELAIEASDILRGFIEGHNQLPIRFQTTREFLEAAATSPVISARQRETLARFLGFCDLGKFAQQPATLAEMTDTVDTAIQFVKSAAAQPGGAA